MVKKIFANKKSTQEKLALIEQQKADAATIEGLKSNLEFVLEDNEELQKELAEKVKELDSVLKKVGVNITKTNTATVTGDGNIVNQDISNSTITINSTNQTHSGTGDNVGRDKITGK